jgi:outer membrane lipoprotein-sorting protein
LLVFLTRRKQGFPRLILLVSAAIAAALSWGCAVSQPTATKPAGPPAAILAASKADLVAQFNQQADAVKSISAGVTMTLTAGSAYTGVIKQYHQITGFILAQRPSSIRVIGQAPVVGTNIFDMVSDGETFNIFVPSQNKFITGAASLERPSAKPIENLRPQHLINAVFWNAIPAGAPVLFEQEQEGNSQFYVLTVVREASGSSAQDWEIGRRIWFDGTDLSIARIEAYDPDGKLVSDVRYSDWDTFSGTRYPRQISLQRPGNDYRLDMGVTKLTLNETITADRFALKQPPGTQLERVGEDAPAAGAKP